MDLQPFKEILNRPLYGFVCVRCGEKCDTRCLRTHLHDHRCHNASCPAHAPIPVPQQPRDFVVEIDEAPPRPDRFRYQPNRQSQISAAVPRRQPATTQPPPTQALMMNRETVPDQRADGTRQSQQRQRVAASPQHAQGYQQSIRQQQSTPQQQVPRQGQQPAQRPSQQPTVRQAQQNRNQQTPAQNQPSVQTGGQQPPAARQRQAGGQQRPSTEQPPPAPAQPATRSSVVTRWYPPAHEPPPAGTDLRTQVTNHELHMRYMTDLMPRLNVKPGPALEIHLRGIEEFQVRCDALPGPIEILYGSTRVSIYLSDVEGAVAAGNWEQWRQQQQQRQQRVPLITTGSRHAHTFDRGTRSQVMAATTENIVARPNQASSSAAPSDRRYQAYVEDAPEEGVAEE